MEEIQRESMDFDVVIVGAGPSGLSTACRLMQLAQSTNQELTVCVVEKGSEVGAHILSGAVLETRALSELFPNWKSENAPISTKVTQDEISFLTSATGGIKLPGFLTPKTMHNEGKYVVSMGNVCRWLAEKAESLGVEIFPGFPAADIIIEDNVVKGIITGDMGLGVNGEQKASYEPGMELRAKYTVFSEGARGHLGKQLIAKYELDKECSVQHYGIGFKEIWDIPAELHEEGKVIHTAGWPLSKFGKEATGGGYLYHAENNQVVVGLIVDLNYANPYLSPFDEFQRLKHHPAYKQYLEGGKRVSYGARAIAKGGLNSLPKMHFPGGLLTGCNAGTLNFSKIKGNHTAMKSGMIAADTIFEAIQAGHANTDLTFYANKFKDSWVFEELNESKSFGGAIHKLGAFFGGAYNTINLNWFNGKLPFAFKDNKPDHLCLNAASSSTRIDYPKPDGITSFDKLSSVFLSNTNHEEEQPCHLKLTDATLPIRVHMDKWAEPAQRYCPAGVYEIVEDDAGQSKFQINAQNCVHCKTCDIKDPSQNITWTTPEGTGGPNYPNM